ncbi:trans-resveratrol di-O-methyltransferase-like [Humulus lupulus]|uniref:trans-resveratrol di-O-methyltransferase-like n=1 Tax=Humulus lupulus TaxID=3486 RepID=UPI002B404F1A|nr:trans-resveratrol di-O-methyltransferase-like [Humulus lupulus]
MAALFHGEGSSSSELSQGQAHLYKHMLSCMSSMSLKCAVQLGIPDIINNNGQGQGQPITLPELVSALQLPPSKTGFVHRLMRLLVHSGFFTSKKVICQNEEEEEEEEEAYGLTPSSRLLLTKGNNEVPSLSPYVLAVLDPAFVNPSHFLGSWFQQKDAAASTTTPFQLAHEGTSLYEYWGKNTEFGAIFDEGMASDAGLLKVVIKDFKPVFEGLTSLVDVGGGNGAFCKILIEAFPHLKCSVLELSHVVADLPNTENLKFIEGDMFQAIPQADAILLKSLLRGCSDEESLTILKKCREAIPSNGGKVVIIEIVIDNTKDEHELLEAKLFFDLLIMVILPGKERSQKEWEKLILKAGFTRYKITPLFGLKSLIEVFP